MKKLALLIITIATMICLASCERLDWKLPSEWAVDKVSEEIDGEFAYTVAKIKNAGKSTEKEDKYIGIYKIEVFDNDAGIRTFIVRIDYHYDDSFFSKMDRLFTDNQMIPYKCITRIDDYEVE